jgi:Flp pilus assembly protein TadG
MAHSTSNPINRFASDERGTVAMIFSLCIFVVFMIVGLAIDVGRVYQTSGRVAASIDAAALAAAKGLRLANLTEAEVLEIAKAYFEAEIDGPGGSYAKIESLSVNIDRAKGSVSIDVVANVPMLFAAVGGIENISVPRSTVAIYDSKDIEVGLQLDVTGSMGGSKIAALKTATKNLIDVLLPDSQTGGAKVRVGFAPFSAGVNVGPYLKAVDGNRASGNDCVYERLTSTNAKTDVLPIGNDAFKIRADLTGGGIQDCPNAQIIPMTDNKTTLKNAVKGYKADGSTAGQLGAAWAWYLVSPTWAPIWPALSKPAAYNDGKTIKTVILMTDGVYNTVGGINYGDGSTQAVNASKLSVDICSGMKDKGVIVYTVGFDLNSAGSQKQRVIDTLTACANQPGMFFRAETGDELDAVFRQIATQIVSLRLSK